MSTSEVYNNKDLKMWFNILPAFLIVTASVGLPGLGLWWAHYALLGNKMWYEILPSFFIITAALGLPGLGLYHCHKLVLGNHYRRTMDDRWDRRNYQRDMRLTGNPYDVRGLEAIPDE